MSTTTNTPAPAALLTDEQIKAVVNSTAFSEKVNELANERVMCIAKILRIGKDARRRQKQIIQWIMCFGSMVWMYKIMQLEKTVNSWGTK